MLASSRWSSRAFVSTRTGRTTHIAGNVNSFFTNLGRIPHASPTPHLHAPAHLVSPAHMPRCHAALSTQTAPSNNITSELPEGVDDKAAVRTKVIANLDKIFQSVPPSSLYRTDIRDAQSFNQIMEKFPNICIINNPKQTLSSPMISFSSDAAIEEIMEAAQKDPGRIKNLCATLRGMGGGKTRAVVEILRGLLQRKNHDVLPLAITFNANMNFQHFERKWVSDKNLNYALSIVLRLASVFYNHSLTSVYQCFQPYVESWRNIAGGLYADELIRGFLAHAFNKIKTCPGRQSISTVVVLLDESVRGEEFFSENGARLDVSSVLRQAVLDQWILPELHTALMMTALDLDPLAPTTSARAIQVIPLPNLDPTKIVIEWWRVPTAYTACWLPLANAVCNLPRATEQVYQAIKGYVDKDPNTLSAEQVATMMRLVKKNIRSQYKVSVLLEYVEPLVLGGKVAWNRAKDAIVNSIYTNNPQKLNSNIILTPEASLLFLSAVIDVQETEEEWAELLHDFLENLSPKKDRDTLEWCLEWWLLRIAVLQVKTAPLLILLGVRNEKLFPNTVRNFNVSFSSQFHKTLKHSSYDSNIRSDPSYNTKGDAFLQEVDEDMMYQAGVLVFRSVARENGDAFDTLLVVRNKEGEPFLVFFDCKSRDPKETSPGLISYHQSEHVLKLAERLSKGVTDIKEMQSRKNATSALATGQFVFIYVSTHPDESSRGLPINSKSHEHVITLHQKGTARLLGPVFNVHQAIRAWCAK